MNEKKLDASLSGMKLAKIVRETAGLNSWQMHKKMGKKSVQAYLSLERSAKRITLEDFFALERIWLEAGQSKPAFEELARKCATKK